MPYSGIKPGSETEKKLERCVKSVMAKNPTWDKSRAIATCRASMKKEVEMAKQILDDVEEGMNLEDLYKDEPISEGGAPEEDKIPPELKEMLSEEADEEEKMMDSVEPYVGPTSFDELDQMREEEEKAEEVRKTAWDTERIVMNIIRSPFLSPDDKAKKMAQAGNDMKSRLSSMMSKKEAEEEFDYDIANLQSILTMEKSFSTTVRDFIGNFKEKPDSVSASDIEDKETARIALKHALGILLDGGDNVDEVKEQLSGLIEKAKKFGVGVPSDSNPTGILVEKEKDGSYRFVGWLSGKWKDRDGDIIRDAAHKEFVEFLEANDDFQIVFRSWHTPGSEREHPIDFWTYRNGFVIVSGKLTEKEAISLMKAQQKRKIGMSHGFFALRDKNDSHVINKYRTFEVSDLPQDRAAFQWSDIPQIMEAKSMNTKLDYLKEVVDPDQMKKIVADTELKETMLAELGVDAKEFDAWLEGEEIETEEKETDETPEPATELDPEIKTLLQKELGIENLDEILAKAQQTDALIPLLKALTTKVDELSVKVEAKELSAQERLAEILSPKNSDKRNLLAKAASKSNDNEMSEEEKEKLMPKHENSWLAEEFGVEPLPEGVK